jgi:hypothetical protein
VTWRNTGTVTETVTFSVNKSPAGSWVLTPASVILNPGQSVTDPVKLNVPSIAIENVTYTARVIATVSSSAAFGSGELRTSAGVNVRFGVGESPGCAASVSPAVSSAPAKKSSSSLAEGVLVVAVIAGVAFFATSARKRRRRRTYREGRRDEREEG